MMNLKLAFITSVIFLSPFTLKVAAAADSIRDCQSALVFNTYRLKSVRLIDYCLADKITREEYDKQKDSGSANVVAYGVPLGANYDRFRENISKRLGSHAVSLSNQEFSDILMVEVGPIGLEAYRACLRTLSLTSGLHFIAAQATESDQTFILRWSPVGSSAKPLQITWSDGATAEQRKVTQIPIGDTTFIFLRPLLSQTIAVNGDGYQDTVILGPLSETPRPTPPECGGTQNAASLYTYSGDLSSNSFLLKVPSCGNFTLTAKMSDYVFDKDGLTGPDRPPVDHVIDIKDSLCLETGSDAHGPFVRIHVDRDCGLRSTPTSQVFYRRSTELFSDPAISNWGDLLKVIKIKNSEL